MTGFGIFWGVVILTLLMGGTQGMEDMLRRNFAGFAPNSGGLVANPTTLPYKGYQKGRKWYLDLKDVEALRQGVPELRTVVPVFQSWMETRISNGRYSCAGSVIGATPEYSMICTPRIYAGRFINESDVANGRKVVVLGKNMVGELFPNDSLPVGKNVLMNGIRYTVVGVEGAMSQATIGGSLDDSAVIPSSTFRKVYNRDDRIDFMVFLARDNVRIADILPRIRRIIYRHHFIAPEDEGAMWSMDVSEMFSMVDKIFLGIGFIAIFIGGSTLLAGIIGIGNIMWVIVKERTQEIGIRRAIGARPSDIVTQILCEGVTLTFVAGIAGILFATIVGVIAEILCNQGDPVIYARFIISGWHALVIVVVFSMLGVAAGLVPAVKAMKIKPVQALNSK